VAIVPASCEKEEKCRTIPTHKVRDTFFRKEGLYAFMGSPGYWIPLINSLCQRFILCGRLLAGSYYTFKYLSLPLSSPNITYLPRA
jgi:hypothetical protein